jgi:hypothetical protein
LATTREAAAAATLSSAATATTTTTRPPEVQVVVLQFRILSDLELIVHSLNATASPLLREHWLRQLMDRRHALVLATLLAPGSSGGDGSVGGGVTGNRMRTWARARFAPPGGSPAAVTAAAAEAVLPYLYGQAAVAVAGAMDTHGNLARALMNASPQQQEQQQQRSGLLVSLVPREMDEAGFHAAFDPHWGWEVCVCVCAEVTPCVILLVRAASRLLMGNNTSLPCSDIQLCTLKLGTPVAVFFMLPCLACLARVLLFVNLPCHQADPTCVFTGKCSSHACDTGLCVALRRCARAPLQRRCTCCSSSVAP